MSVCFAGYHPANAQYPGFDSPSTRTASGTAVGIVPVVDNVDGGTIPIGATTQIVVRFRNDGGKPIETGKINLYPSSNVTSYVSLNQCIGEPLPTGAECAVALSVKGLQAGSWRVEMLMLHSGQSRLVTSTLSGTIESTGESSDTLSSDLETIPGVLDFGSLSTAKTIIESVILRNITSNKINISDIKIATSEAESFSVNADCDALDAGQACIATIKWSPKQAGPAKGTLVVKHDGPTKIASVAISGEYSPDESDEAQIFPDAVPGKGLLVSSQTEIDFGGDIATASTITVSLVNTGDTAITLSDVVLSGSDNGLALKQNGCVKGTILEPIEACPLILTWSPTRVGNLLDDVQISHDGARGILVLPVRGEATSVVSQDQKAINLTKTVRNFTDYESLKSYEKNSNTESQQEPQQKVDNSGVLDGFKITSFSTSRAIINGPGGSRLIFDKEPIMVGGVAWNVDINQNGIEFSNDGDRILLLFDRSLSGSNNTSASTSGTSSANSDSEAGN